MGKIVISSLVVHAFIGVYAHEQLTQQPLSIDLSFSVDVLRASQNDALSDTQDYAKLCNSITLFVQQTRYRLLETLAKNLVDYLKREFQLSQLELSITKKPTDMPTVSGVRVVVSDC